MIIELKIGLQSLKVMILKAAIEAWLLSAVNFIELAKSIDSKFTQPVVIIF
jgi:hypothetical protein